MNLVWIFQLLVIIQGGNRMKKIISIFMILCLFTSVFAFDKTVVEDGLTEFIDGLADSAPAVSTMNNVWADGYVGQLIGIPPHFGVGASAGVAKMDVTGVKKAAKELGISAVDKLNDDFVLPVASVQAVIGGLFLPFDISGSFMTIKEPLSIGEDALQYKFDCFNVKLRLPILKQNVVLPNLSIGVGYSKISGYVLANLADSTTFLKTSFASEVYSADVQLSKSVIFLTPYVGARLLASKSDNSWEYAFDVAGVVSEKGNGTYKTADDKMDISYQVFAGTSFNILILKINANAAYDIKTKVWSAGLGLAVQL